MDAKMEELKKRIREEHNKERVVYMSPEGPMVADMESFLKQPTEGILYDLNRDQAVVLSWMDEERWVNDLAVGFVIAALKDQVQALEKELAEITLKYEMALKTIRETNNE